jgi:hypothetical protein
VGPGRAGREDWEGGVRWEDQGGWGDPRWVRGGKTARARERREGGLGQRHSARRREGSGGMTKEELGGGEGAPPRSPQTMWTALLLPKKRRMTPG